MRAGSGFPKSVRMWKLLSLVKAFASANLPLEKLAVGSPLREYFCKYMPQCAKGGTQLVDPDNLRRTWLPKVMEEGLFAYLSAPCSAAQAERTFSLLDHIQTDDRLSRDLMLLSFMMSLHTNMSDTVLEALAFVCINKSLFADSP